MKALTILLIEDDSDYACLVRRWLSGNHNQSEFVMQWTDSLAGAITRLEQGGIDLLLLDLGLPDSDGIETLISIQSKAGGLPILILSAGDDDALALHAIQQR